MDKYHSQKIRILNFISILAVVFWHAYLAPTPAREFSGFYLFQNLITSAFLRFSIPMFFAISGYLFFFKPFHYWRQVQKRIKTLLLPYLIWSLLGTLLIYGLLLLPVTRNIINMQWEFNISHFLRHITIEPVQYQFWFLRDLMILAVFSPVIFFMSKKLPVLWVTMLTIIWFLVGDRSYIVRVESLLFFLLGAILAIRGGISWPKKNKNLLLILSGTLWLTISLYYGYSITKQCFPEIIPPNIWYGLSKLTGLAFIWIVYDVKKVNKFLNHHLAPKVLNGTFFLFCFHEPLLTIFEKLSLQIIIDYNVFSYFFYFFNPLLSITVSFFVYRVLSKHTPGILKALTGNRTN
ncbi:MAG: hypothetical protein PWQ06_1167 [Anaerophaga sp.]|nr:hypothetical protein [Anaerophaga sp.]